MVTITATLVGDTTKTISATITITPPQPIAISFEAVTPASLQINAIYSFSAKITNDISANPQVKWSATCPGGPCGSFNPATTTNEASSSYTAPSAIPSGNVVTVTATSVTDPTKSASANVTITALAPTLPAGTYVFQVSGPTGPGANSISGVFTALSGGVISGGEQDYANYALNQTSGQNLPLFDPISGGTYSTTPDGHLQITLRVIDTNIGGPETLAGTIVSPSKVLLTEVNGSIGTGTLDLQTSKAAPSGGYAFSTFGVDFNGQPATIGGILDIGSAGVISQANSLLDINDNSVFLPSQSLGVSTVSAPDSLGRVVLQLAPTTPSEFASFYLAGYIVDAAHIRLVETANDNFQGVMGGTALSQETNTGHFTSASLAGSTYVFGAGGAGLDIAGLFTADAGGGITGTLNWNDLGNLTGNAVQSPTIFTGSYVVDALGRATLSNLSDGSTFTYQLEFYLTGSGQGLLLSSDPTKVIAGRAFQQPAGPFNLSSLSGSYGLSAIEIGTTIGNSGDDAALGTVTAASSNGVDLLTGFADFGDGSTDLSLSGSLTVATDGVATGTLSGLNRTTFTSYTVPNNFAVYLIDNTRGVLIETDNSQLTLGYLELEQ
jgi:hypothetical protein